MSSTSSPRERGGPGAAAHEAGDAGRVAHHVPRVVVEGHAHQQVAGEHLLLHDDLPAVLELDDVLHRDDDLEDLFLDVHRTDAAGEVLLDLVLVARVRVHDEPVAGPVVRTGLPRLDLVVIVEDVEQVGVGEVTGLDHFDDLDDLDDLVLLVAGVGVGDGGVERVGSVGRSGRVGAGVDGVDGVVGLDGVSEMWSEKVSQTLSRRGRGRTWRIRSRSRRSARSSPRRRSAR